MDNTLSLKAPTNNIYTLPEQVREALPPAAMHGDMQPAGAPISATVLTHRCGKHLPAVLAALHWCQEIVVMDSSPGGGEIASPAKGRNNREDRRRSTGAMAVPSLLVAQQ